MNKQDFITKLAEKMDTTKKAANENLNAVIDTITEVLVSGDEIVFTGFGKFGTKVQPGREGTLAFGEHKGETWKSEDKTVPYFKPGANLKEIVK